MGCIRLHLRLIFTTIVIVSHVQSQRQRGSRSTTTVPSTRLAPPPGPAVAAACESSSCYPATGDLLIGRAHQLSSTSTCGLNRPERFCLVSHLEDGRTSNCFICDSRLESDPRNSHRIDQVISSFRWDWKMRWWQAEAGVQEVSIRLDLEAEFHLTHIILQFKTFRPSAMLIERSGDFGKTWKVYRYFAHNCGESFPGVSTNQITDLQEVICESRYSDVAPSTEGEVIFRVLPASVFIENPYQEDVQDLLKITNLRVNFTKLHTLGDNLLDNRPGSSEKYYYALYNVVIRGSCSCYGHASRCLPSQDRPTEPNMVHGRCECMHNTKGFNCEQCEDYFNDLPWRPALNRQANACKRCECHNHATRCHFDPAVYEATGRQSGGVCDDCLHNTIGHHCDECLPHYYLSPNKNIDDVDACQPCDCDPAGSQHSGECEPLTDVMAGVLAGSCLCKQYTTGPRCSSCLPGYFNLQASNEDGCQACYCDTVGTVDAGRHCDETNGECLCKRYVTGRQCNTCLEGYWGLSVSPQGCKACDCDVGGAESCGCNQLSGECKCRTYVEGRDCDHLSPGYFAPNLDYLVYEAESARGTGSTRVVIWDAAAVGRRVTWTGPGFMRASESDSIEFTLDDIPASIDYQIVIRYEPQGQTRWDDVRAVLTRPKSPSAACAEGETRFYYDSRQGVSSTEANIVRPTTRSVPPRRRPTTTPLPPLRRPARAVSPGPEDAPEEDGSGDVDDEIGQEYIIDRRYGRDTKFDSNVVTKTRTTSAQTIETRFVRIDGNDIDARHYVMTPSVCLEKGVVYKLEITFNSFKTERRGGGANVLIDSLVLIPSPSSVPAFQQSCTAGTPSPHDEFDRLRCIKYQWSAGHTPMPAACKKLLFSLSVAIYGGGLPCDCDRIGSERWTCETIGGQCQCKPNVTGRRCDQCIPGRYGLDQDGCKACDCDTYGSRDTVCEGVSGQCQCKPGVFGRQCNRCRRGMYQFPSCRPCECQGRAEECDDNGVCIGCEGNTGGPNCERCADGYYEDPIQSSAALKVCLPCLCPGGAGGRMQYGDTCHYDVKIKDVVCDCKEGYSGLSCEKCDENYYGQPLSGSGPSCKRCGCNGNIDYGVPGSCDSVTGECLKCLFNTEGGNCERCLPGFYGDASKQSCTQCICNILGTNRTNGAVQRCDSITGQCSCLPNVTGRACDHCIEDHWKMATGTGCEPCQCETFGSSATQCNEYDGQCVCKDGHGGRQCNECPELHWGHPDIFCQPCDCDTRGSMSRQCDKTTGACKCLPGVSRDRCDRCAQGTYGSIPDCLPCGECFDSWQRTVIDVANETEAVLRLGLTIKVGGIPGEFDRDLKRLDAMLDQVKLILNGSQLSDVDIKSLLESLSVIRLNLTSSHLDSLSNELDDTSGLIESVNNRIAQLKLRYQTLLTLAKQLVENATQVSELDTAGARNSTYRSLERSNMAARRVAETQTVDSEVFRLQVNDLISADQRTFDGQVATNQADVDQLAESATHLDSRIKDINHLVCSGLGDPCDDVCGGAGCGKCGGSSSCQDGAVSKASSAGDFSRRADSSLREKAEQVEEINSESSCRKAAAEADAAENLAELAHNSSVGERDELRNMLEQIADFLTNTGSISEDTRDISNEVLAMQISLTPQQIRDLARKINQTVQGLTRIDAILKETDEHLKTLARLRNGSITAKKNAEAMREAANRVTANLDAANKIQENVTQTVIKTTAKTDIIDQDLIELESNMDRATRASRGLATRAESLRERLKAVQQRNVENGLNVQRARDESDTAADLANKAEQEAATLEGKYKEVSAQLKAKYDATNAAKQKADAIKQRTMAIFEDISQKVKKLQEMGNQYGVTETKVADMTSKLQTLSTSMTNLIKDITQAAVFLRTC